MRFNFKEFRNILKSLIDRFSEFFSIIEGISGRKERENFFSNSVACSSPDVTEYPSGGVLVYLKRIPSRGK